MKQMLNTLYLTTPDCRLTLLNNAVVVEKPDGEKTRITANLIDSIYCFGNASFTMPLARFCDDRQIRLVFLSPHGQYIGTFRGRTSGNVTLRYQQYCILQQNGQQRLDLVRQIMTGKLTNAKNFLLRQAREADSEQVRQCLRAAAEDQQSLLDRILEERSIDAIRGLEGSAAGRYYGVFGQMIRCRDEALTFHCRSRRPPKDRVNALLSFLYTLLASDAGSALEAVGLDPECGYMHELRSGKPALAVDLMEELRAPLCDRLALAMLNRRQLTAGDFEPAQEEGGIWLNAAGRDKVLAQWQQKKNEVITHPVLGEKIRIGQIMFCQARLLASAVRGDVPDYRPLLWR